jgi:hypothetical protein
MLSKRAIECSIEANDKDKAMAERKRGPSQKVREHFAGAKSQPECRCAEDWHHP